MPVSIVSPAICLQLVWKHASAARLTSALHIGEVDEKDDSVGWGAVINVRRRRIFVFRASGGEFTRLPVYRFRSTAKA